MYDKGLSPEDVQNVNDIVNSIFLARNDRDRRNLTTLAVSGMVNHVKTLHREVATKTDELHDAKYDREMMRDLLDDKDAEIRILRREIAAMQSLQRARAINR